MAYHFTKNQIRKAMQECNGTYRDLAKKLKIKSGGYTSKKQLEKYPDLVEEFIEKQNDLVDTAENALLDILNNDTSSDVVKSGVAQFILKSIGKNKWGNTEEDTESKLVDLITKLIDNAEKS